MSERRFRRTPEGVSSLGLHVVWCPKYRRRTVGGRVARPLSELLEQIADEHAWQIMAKEVTPDHVHLFVRVGPTDAPAQVVRAFKFKGRTARAAALRVSAFARPREGVVVTVVLRGVGRLRLESTVRRYIEHPLRRGDGVMRRAYVFRLRLDRTSAHRPGGVCGSPTAEPVQRRAAGAP